jgi:hypothetical protein
MVVTWLASSFAPDVGSFAFSLGSSTALVVAAALGTCVERA